MKIFNRFKTHFYRRVPEMFLTLRFRNEEGLYMIKFMKNGSVLRISQFQELEPLLSPNTKREMFQEIRNHRKKHFPWSVRWATGYENR